MKCVVIGIGHVALERYLPTLSEMDDVSLACLSRNPESARAAAEAFSAEFLPDMAALARWEPDIAFVLTSDTQHVGVLDALFDIGVPRIYVEKPLAAAHGQARIDANDLRDGERLLAVARAKGIEVAMGYNYRHFETVVRARDEIRRRGWSEATGVTATTHYACLSHVFDLIGVFVGDLDQLVALRGTGQHGTGELRSEDRVVAFTAHGGASGALRATSSSPWSDSLFELAVTYPEGSLHLADLDGTFELYDARDGRRERSLRGDERSRSDGYDASFRASIRAYMASVRAGIAPPSDGEAGLRELRLHTAVAEAIASGSVATVAR